MTAGKRFDMEEEFAGLDFHSIRLEDRFIRTMETLSKQPDVSIWEASENRAEAKAIYRMLSNEAFDPVAILRAHREATIRRMVDYGGTILVVQDTTGVNYNTHLKTEGIGYISDKTMGVNVHSCLAVSTDGLVLGILDQSSYNRSGAKDDSASHESKKVRPIEEKESLRWRGLKSTKVRRNAGTEYGGPSQRGQGDNGMRPGRGYGGLTSIGVYLIKKFNHEGE
jgi:hypothetical protein